jgi:hypothetical protein
MSRQVSQYKKAAKAMRTFQKMMQTQDHFNSKSSSFNTEAAKNDRKTFWDAQENMRIQLDKHLGAAALSELYWEGKTL